MCSIMGWCSSSADKDVFAKGFSATVSRGPDCTKIMETPDGILGFHRLAIMGLTPEGMQPFCLEGDMVVYHEDGTHASADNGCQERNDEVARNACQMDHDIHGSVALETVQPVGVIHNRFTPAEAGNEYQHGTDRV